MAAEFLRNVNNSFNILNVRVFDIKAASPLAQESNDKLERRRRLKDAIVCGVVRRRAGGQCLCTSAQTI